MNAVSKQQKRVESVQLHAALRNEYVEMLVDFCLRKSLKQLEIKGIIESAGLPERHKEFKTVDASDIFDHYFRAKFLATGEDVAFWGQTTCYKGNELGVAEANKTYEIRETLVEALTLRRHLMNRKEQFRVLHFTFGPSAYTYGWFEGAKANTFDLSFYSSDVKANFDIFTDLFAVLHGATAELEVYERLEAVMSGGSSELKDFLNAFINKLEEWFTALPERNEMADKQAQVLNAEFASVEKELNAISQASKNGGENIKGKVIDAIASGKTTDPVIEATLKRVYEGNGFISKALEALKDWTAWEKRMEPQISDELSLPEAINNLWNAEGEIYIIRRLLVRLFASDEVHYPADLNIRGVTEHTLYTVMYAPEINEQIVAYLLKKYQASKVNDTKTLKSLVFSTRAKQIIVDALKHDTSNGTNLKPSFYYVEEALKKDFRLVSFDEAGLPLPVGYQTHFAGAATVQAYGNLKVVVDKNNKPVAILKAKYFRKQEFPRRAKEEAYVGLTAKYDIEGQRFTTRYKLPFIMFIDMDTNLVPPEFALFRLATCGWLPIFKIEALRNHLNTLT